LIYLLPTSCTIHFVYKPTTWKCTWTALDFIYFHTTSVKEPPVNANNVTNKGTLLKDKWSLYTHYTHTLHTHTNKHTLSHKHTLHTLHTCSHTHTHTHT